MKPVKIPKSKIPIKEMPVARIDNTRKNLAILSCISIIIVVITAVATENLFNTFIDAWGYKVYFDQLIAPFLMYGDLPYIDNFWEYPVLMLIPVILAAIPAFIMQDLFVFITVFRILMVVCNLIVMAGIYLIALHILKSSRLAFTAGFLYAVSISAAYIAVTNFDPLPTCFMMIGLYYTIVGDGKKVMTGYLFSILGFFTKIYPIISLPFTILFNAKTTSLKQEIISAVKVGIIPFFILFVPIFAMNQNSIDTYLISNAAGKEAFVASFVYTLYSWIHDVFHINAASIYIVSTVMSATLVGVMLGLLYVGYKAKEKDPRLLLGLVLIALVAIIALSKYHSPQYMLWIMPILCILIVENLVQIILYCLLQIIWYIKFPLLFYTLYTNNSYVHPLPHWMGYAAVIFFTVEYAILFYLVWDVTKVRILDVIREVEV